MESRPDRRNEIIAGVIMVAIILCGIAYFFSVSSPSSPEVPARLASSTTSISTTTSATSTGGVNVQVSGIGGATVTISNPAKVPPPAPELFTRLSVASTTDLSLTPIAVATLQKNITAAVADLRTNPTDESTWVALGVDRQELDDYAGALEDFQYALKLSFNDPVALNNIAYLYGFYLAMPSEAVTYYKEAIAADPSEVSFYTNLSQVYYYQLHDVADAQAILEAGIADKVSGYQNLQSTLNSLPQ